MTGVAKFVENLKGWNGEAAAYEIDPPVEFRNWERDAMGKTRYLIVSSVDFSDLDIGAPLKETALFVAEKSGNTYEVIDADVLDVYEGWCDHARALRNAGYEIE